MHIVKNWGVVVSERLGVPEPDWPQHLVGYIKDSSLMSDPITEVKQESGYKVIVCGNTEYSVYPKDVNPAYERAWPGAYRNLK